MEAMTQDFINQKFDELYRKLERTTQKVTIFIDHTNLDFTIKKIDTTGCYRLCFNKLISFLANGRSIQQTRFYYSDYGNFAKLEKEEHQRRMKREDFYFWLKKQGFWLKRCDLVERADGKTREKGLDAAIIKDITNLCQRKTTDTIILVSGDYDYAEVVLDAQNSHFTPVEVAFFAEHTSKDFIYSSSKFINLSEVKESLKRK